LSPQTRRGKAAPASHRKSSSRGASAATRKPGPAIKEIGEEQLDDGQLDELAPVPVRPRRRARGLARAKRTSGWRYASDALGAYVPLIIAFVVVFGGVWAWISFGPHPPTPRENWVRIDSTWQPKVAKDLQKVADTKSDFTAQMAAYTALGSDLNGWASDLTLIISWDSATATPNPSSGSTTPNADLVQAFINALDQQSSNISSLTTAANGTEIDATATMVAAGDKGLAEAYAAAYRQLVGTAPPSTNPTIAVPSLGICAPASPAVSPTPAVSPGPTPSLAASGSPTAAPTIELCVPPPPSRSPGPAGSAG
jgi:hypothetical protein